MDHRDHVRLLQDGVQGAGKTWADLGSINRVTAVSGSDSRSMDQFKPDMRM